MKRKFTFATGFFMLGAIVSTVQCVGTWIQGGWASYMWGFIAISVVMWWLVWLSTKPEEE